MDESLKLTYVGGPTVLLEFGDVRILTDPTFDPAGGEYPSGPATLRKLTGPAVEAQTLGSIDVIVLSHDQHFDNLDHKGRKILQTAKVVITTSEGTQRLGDSSMGLRDWDSYDFVAASGRTLRIVATPARHGPAGRERGSVIGFVLFFADNPKESIYISGDTVWYEGVEEVARRFPVRLALLHMGAARVPEVGPFHLTLTAEEAVQTSRAFSGATIVPVHFEGWAHFSEGKDDIVRAFQKAGLEKRLFWLKAGTPVELRLTSAG